MKKYLWLLWGLLVYMHTYACINDEFTFLSEELWWGNYGHPYLVGVMYAVCFSLILWAIFSLFARIESSKSFLWWLVRLWIWMTVLIFLYVFWGGGTIPFLLWTLVSIIVFEAMMVKEIARLYDVLKGSQNKRIEIFQGACLMALRSMWLIFFVIGITLVGDWFTSKNQFIPHTYEGILPLFVFPISLFLLLQFLAVFLTDQWKIRALVLSFLYFLVLLVFTHL